MAARCQLEIFGNGNWQPDANSILEGLKRLKFNGKPDVYLLSLMNWQLVTGSQMLNRF